MRNIDELLGRKISIYKEKKGGKNPRTYTGILLKKKSLFWREYQYYISDNNKVRKVRRGYRAYFDDGTFCEF